MYRSAYPLDGPWQMKHLSKSSSNMVSSGLDDVRRSHLLQSYLLFMIVSNKSSERGFGSSGGGDKILNEDVKRN